MRRKDKRLLDLFLHSLDSSYSLTEFSFELKAISYIYDARCLREYFVQRLEEIKASPIEQLTHPNECRHYAEEVWETVDPSINPNNLPLTEEEIERLTCPKLDKDTPSITAECLKRKFDEMFMHLPQRWKPAMSLCPNPSM